MANLIRVPEGDDPIATEEAEDELDARPDYEMGEKVWVQDGEGTRHPGIYIRRNGSGSWFGKGPSAVVFHELGHHSEIVSVFRITPRD